MHAMVLDSKGNAALIHLKDLPSGIMRTCEALKIWETGEVVKATNKYLFPTTAPTAKILYAHTRYGYEHEGHKAMVWKIGLQAENGFSIPSRECVESCYVIVCTENPTNLENRP